MKKPEENSQHSRINNSFWGNIFTKKADDQEDILTTLRKLPLFTNMSDGELREFEKLIHRRQFKANETIFWEGEPGVGMYVIRKGGVAICKHLPGEEREELVVLREGEFFGELALLNESPRSASAISKNATQIIGLFRPDLFELLERKPRLGNKFLFQLALIIGERLKRTNSEMQNLRAKIESSDIII